jgi:hypothetical protein
MISIITLIKISFVFWQSIDNKFKLRVKKFSIKKGIPMNRKPNEEDSKPSVCKIVE